MDLKEVIIKDGIITKNEETTKLKVEIPYWMTGEDLNKWKVENKEEIIKTLLRIKKNPKKQ